MVLKYQAALKAAGVTTFINQRNELVVGNLAPATTRRSAKAPRES